MLDMPSRCIALQITNAALIFRLKAVKQRKHGHWADRKNLQQELAQFVQSNASGTPEGVHCFHPCSLSGVAMNAAIEMASELVIGM